MHKTDSGPINLRCLLASRLGVLHVSCLIGATMCVICVIVNIPARFSNRLTCIKHLLNDCKLKFPKNRFKIVLNIFFSIQTFKSEFNEFCFCAVNTVCLFLLLSLCKWLFATLQTSDINLWIFIEFKFTCQTNDLQWRCERVCAFGCVALILFFFYFGISLCLVMPNILQCYRPQI